MYLVACGPAIQLHLYLTFQKFKDFIAKSRTEAEQAEVNIPEIERLINSANNKSDEADGSLGDSLERALKAQNTADKASNTANRAKQVGLAKMPFNLCLGTIVVLPSSPSPSQLRRLVD